MATATRDIRRYHRPPRLWHLDVDSLAELECSSFVAEAEGWLAVDLSLGGWSSHQAGRELLHQLGESETLRRGRIYDRSEIARSQKSDALLSRLIDSESRGNAWVLAALDLAERVVLALARSDTPMALTVLAPRWGLPWRQENLQFISFLAQGLSDLPHRLAVVTVAGEDELPKIWRLEMLPKESSVGDTVLRSAEGSGLLPWLPGLLRSAWCEGLDLEPDRLRPFGREMLSGAFLLAPELRARPTVGSRISLDRLAAAARLPDSVRAFGQVFGNAYFRDLEILCGTSWSSFGEGSYEIARDLMCRVVGTSQSSEEKLRFLWELQGMRLAAQDFAGAAAVEDPPTGLDKELRGGLAMSKGWAQAMLGRGAESRSRLEQARELLRESMAGSRFGLYLENIYALSLLRCGEAEKALEIERGIASHLQERRRRHGEPERALEYVNAINQARLLRRLGDLDSAERSYRRAFSVTLGTRSDYDHLYTNFCLARMLADRGDLGSAFEHWLRAALHWAATKCPEAVTARIAGGLLRRRVEAPHTCTDELSSAVHEQLVEAALAAGLEGVCDRGGNAEIPTFCRLSEASPHELRESALWGRPGASVVISGPSRRPPFDGPGHRRLRACLSGFFADGAPGSGAPQGTIFVDTGLGHEMATTRDECRLTAARYGIPRVISDGVSEDCPPSPASGQLLPAPFRDLLLRCLCESSPAVAAIEEPRPGDPRAVRVRFTRLLRDRPLDSREVSVVRLVLAAQDEGEPLTLRKLMNTEAVDWPLIRSLEEAHVLRLRPPGSADSNAIRRSAALADC